MSGVRREQQLVLDACRAAMGGPALGPEAVEVDAGATADLAQALGVLGVVASRIRVLPGADPRWTTAWLENASRNLASVALLGRAIDALRSAGVDPILIKGPALAHVAYGSLAARDWGDLDLVVPDVEFAAACDALQTLGLRPRWVGDVRQASVEEVQFILGESDPPAVVDLHRGWLARWGRLRWPGQHLVQIELGGRLVRTFDPALTLVFAAVHCVQHQYALRTLMDVALADRTARDAGGFDRARALASAIGVGRGFESAVRAAADLAALGYAPRLRGRLGTPEVVVSPHRIGRWDLRTWLDTRSSLRPWALLAALARGVWLPAGLVSGTPEWVGPERRLVRRLVRPLRLARYAVRRV